MEIDVELLRVLKNRTDAFNNCFKDSDQVSISEKSWGITESSVTDWQLVSLSYDKGKILSVLKAASPGSVLSAEHREIIKDTCDLFELAGQDNNDSSSHTLDREILKCLTNVDTHSKLSDDAFEDPSILHLSFILMMKRSHIRLLYSLQNVTENEQRLAMRLAEAWIYNFDWGSFSQVRQIPKDLKYMINAAKKLVDEGTQGGKIRGPKIECPKCKDSFTYNDRLDYLLKGEGLLFEFLSHPVIGDFFNNDRTVGCPKCNAMIDEGLLKPVNFGGSRPSNSDRSTNNSPPKEESGCFIATAIFSSESQEVKVLQHFRDSWLVHTRYGKELIHLYYRFGPSLAKTIGKSKMAKMIIGFFLKRFVNVWSKRN